MTTTQIAKGTRFGPYEIVEPLKGGEGGMGAIYIARPRTGYGGPPRVTLKVAHGSHNDFLKNEIDYLLQFDDPHILHVLPIEGYSKPGRPVYIAKAETPGEDDVYYIVVDYMPGGSVAQLLAHRKRLSCAEAIEIASQVAGAMITIHARQIVHLDIKPSNILLRERLSRFGEKVPHAVVSDFGIACEVGRAPTQTVYGSPHYTAPERATGGPPQLQNDVFSLGVMLYEMVVGEPPFTDVVPPGTPLLPARRPSALNRTVIPELEQVILRAIETDPRQRYQTMQQFKAALDHVPVRRPAPIKVPLIQGVHEWVILGLTPVVLILLFLVTIGLSSATGTSMSEAWFPTSTPTITPTASPTSTPITAVYQSTPTTIPSPTTAPVGQSVPTSTMAPTQTPTETPTPVPTVYIPPPPPPAPVYVEPPAPVYVEPPAPVYVEPQQPVIDWGGGGGGGGGGGDGGGDTPPPPPWEPPPEY